MKIIKDPSMKCRADEIGAQIYELPCPKFGLPYTVEVLAHSKADAEAVLRSHKFVAEDKPKEDTLF